MKEYTPFTSRKKLIDSLPLNTPFGIHICPTTYCNFKCAYCKHASAQMQKEIKEQFMDIDFFQMIVEQIKKFPDKLKLLNFAWLGEPLLHPQIAEMVKIAKDADIAERVEIVSNASRLTPALCDALVDAGLDRMRISLQGLTKEDYWDISQYKINFENFVDNIAYFYKKSRRGKTKIYIKIMDAMLKSPSDEKKFQQTFSDICDQLNIETLVTIIEENDISDMKTEFENTYWKNEVKKITVCSQPFYVMVVSPEGIVLPCCESGNNLSIGKISESNTIVDIWNGNKLQSIRRMMIESRRFEHPVCADCNVVTYQTAPEDNLDEYIEELQAKFGK